MLCFVLIFGPFSPSAPALGQAGRQACPPDCAWAATPLYAGVPAVALWTSANRLIVAYGGDPTAPSLHWVAAPRPPKALPLGARAQGVGLYPIGEGQFALLWRDQTADIDSQILVATLTADGEIVRFPAALTARPTAAYAAAPAPNGSLSVIWVERSTPTAPVFSAQIDGVGRPLPGRKLADDGAFPAALYDSRERLHAGWLQRGAGGLWTAYHTLITDTTPRPAPIGLFRLAEGEFVAGYALASGGGQVYALWQIGTLGADGAVALRVGGVAFPEGNPSQTQVINVDGLPTEGVQRFGVAANGGLPGADSVLVWASTQGMFSARLRGGGMESAGRLAALPPGLIGEISAVANSGDLSVALPMLDSGGKTILYTLLASLP